MGAAGRSCGFGWIAEQVAPGEQGALVGLAAPAGLAAPVAVAGPGRLASVEEPLGNACPWYRPFSLRGMQWCGSRQWTLLYSRSLDWFTPLDGKRPVHYNRLRLSRLTLANWARLVPAVTLFCCWTLNSGRRGCRNAANSAGVGGSFTPRDHRCSSRDCRS